MVWNNLTDAFPKYGKTGDTIVIGAIAIELVATERALSVASIELSGRDHLRRTLRERVTGYSHNTLAEIHYRVIPECSFDLVEIKSFLLSTFTLISYRFLSCRDETFSISQLKVIPGNEIGKMFKRRGNIERLLFTFSVLFCACSLTNDSTRMTRKLKLLKGITREQ